MLAADPSPFGGWGNELAAAATLLVAVGLIVLANQVLRRGRTLRDALDLDPVVDTRLRLVRRLLTATIAVIGVATALSQFTELNRLAASLLASSAIVAAIVGFAAQRSLANVIAGILLAVTQPIRIGDVVTFEDETGTVEDVRLAHTFLRTGSDARLVVPNERLAGGLIRNDTIVSRDVGTEVALWLPATADADRAATLAREEAGDGATVRVAEMDPEGRVRLAVVGPHGPPEERLAREADLRAACLRRLRSAGLLAEEGEERAPSGRS